LSVFGDFAGPEDVEEAVLAALQEWMPTYIKRVEENRGLEPGALPQIRSYSIVSDYDRYPQEQLPAIVIESAGVVGGSITKEGTGYYSAKYVIEVSVTTAAEDAVAVRKGAQRYGEAVRGSLLQHRSLGSGSIGKRVDWADESLIGENDNRKRRVTCVNSFRVDLRNIVSVKEGPIAPDPVSDEWPEVTSIEVDVENES
jgi:hypothetical protein